MSRYYIRYEQMNGSWFYMIYQKAFWGDLFLERWNAPESAIRRLIELSGGITTPNNPGA